MNEHKNNRDDSKVCMADVKETLERSGTQFKVTESSISGIHNTVRSWMPYSIISHNLVIKRKDYNDVLMVFDESFQLKDISVDEEEEINPFVSPEEHTWCIYVPELDREQKEIEKNDIIWTARQIPRKPAQIYPYQDKALKLIISPKKGQLFYEHKI